MLAGRALRALKSAGFEDVGLVGRAIEVLAGSYWRMKTGGGGKALRDAFEEELREVRLQETKSIGRDRVGKARDDFSINWDGRRLMLDRHLKNNTEDARSQALPSCVFHLGRDDTAGRDRPPSRTHENVGAEVR